MRLKEPLYGINIVNLHFVYHFGLALTMIFIEIQHPIKIPKDLKEKCDMLDPPDPLHQPHEIMNLEDMNPLE